MVLTNKLLNFTKVMEPRRLIRKQTLIANGELYKYFEMFGKL